MDFKWSSPLNHELGYFLSVWLMREVIGTEEIVSKSTRVSTICPSGISRLPPSSSWTQSQHLHRMSSWSTRILSPTRLSHPWLHWTELNWEQRYVLLKMLRYFDLAMGGTFLEYKTPRGRNKGMCLLGGEGGGKKGGVEGFEPVISHTIAQQHPLCIVLAGSTWQ